MATYQDETFDFEDLVSSLRSFWGFRVCNVHGPTYHHHRHLCHHRDDQSHHHHSYPRQRSSFLRPEGGAQSN